MASITVQVSQRGGITLPKGLRDAYGVAPGDNLTVLDLGGVFVLSPRRSRVDALADEVAAGLQSRGEGLESMLDALRAERDGC